MIPNHKGYSIPVKRRRLQVIRPTLLIEGFEAVEHENLQVTDDVSMIEAIGKPVKMTEGSYTNIKVLIFMTFPVYIT